MHMACSKLPFLPQQWGEQEGGGGREEAGGAGGGGSRREGARGARRGRKGGEEGELSPSFGWLSGWGRHQKKSGSPVKASFP
jgi:hypothetical protein